MRDWKGVVWKRGRVAYLIEIKEGKGRVRNVGEHVAHEGVHLGVPTPISEPEEEGQGESDQYTERKDK